MSKFKLIKQAQGFLSTQTQSTRCTHGASFAEVYNLYNLSRHLVAAKNYRLCRDLAFVSWKNAVIG